MSNEQQQVDNKWISRVAVATCACNNTAHHTDTDTHTDTHTQTHTRTHARTHAQTHTHTHTQKHTHTHTHTPARLEKRFGDVRKGRPVILATWAATWVRVGLPEKTHCGVGFRFEQRAKGAHNTQHNTTQHNSMAHLVTKLGVRVEPRANRSAANGQLKHIRQCSTHTLNGLIKLVHIARKLLTCTQTRTHAHVRLTMELSSMHYHQLRRQPPFPPPPQVQRSCTHGP